MDSKELTELVNFGARRILGTLGVTLTQGFNRNAYQFQHHRLREPRGQTSSPG
jgi:hypothetical protein